MRGSRILLPLLVILPLGLPVRAAAAERLALTEFALGTTCAILNIGYGPLKVVYAVLGTTTGVSAWLITGGDSHIARRLIQPALRGDYAIVPDHLTFDRPLRFTGRDPRGA